MMDLTVVKGTLRREASPMSDPSSPSVTPPPSPALAPRRGRRGLSLAILVLLGVLLIWGGWAFLSLLNPLFQERGPVAELDSQLKLHNPGFPGVERTYFYGPWLNEVSLPADQLSDLSPLCSVKGLRSVYCLGTEGKRNQGLLKDLGPLKGLPLRQVILHHIPVRDLTPLEGMPMRRLQLVDLPIEDLTPLETLTGLRELNASSEGVRDLKPLAKLPLNQLYLRGTAVTDLSPLRGLPLYVLDCRDSPGIRDLTPLESLPLRLFGCDPDLLRDPANVAALKRISTLEEINGQPASAVLP
jgi:hypothetical protein